MTILAFDEGNRIETDNFQLTVRVIRNLHTPVFSAPIYKVTIRADEPLGVGIIQVQATDKDQGVSGEVRYTIYLPTSVPQAEISNYFFINPTTGVLSVKRSLTEDNALLTNYKVKLVDTLGTTFGNSIVCKLLRPPFKHHFPQIATVS